jgi:hypothetical protein
MDNKPTIIILAVIATLILLWIFSDRITNSILYKKVSHWLYKDFLRFPPSEGLFQIAWDGFLFFASIWVVLYISEATRMVNMTTIQVIVASFFFLALMSTIRIGIQKKLIARQPPDTRLDTIISELGKLNTLIAGMEKLTDAVGQLIEEIKTERKEHSKSIDKDTQK